MLLLKASANGLINREIVFSVKMSMCVSVCNKHLMYLDSC